MSDLKHITILDHLNSVLSKDNADNKKEKGSSAMLRLDLRLDENGELVLDASGVGSDDSFVFSVSEENELAIGGIMKLVARRITRELRGQTAILTTLDDANFVSE